MSYAPLPDSIASMENRSMRAKICRLRQVGDTPGKTALRCPDAVGW